MRRSMLLVCVAVLTLAPGPAQAVLGGWQNNSSDGVPVCLAPDNQSISAMVPVASGGFIAVWADHRNGTDDDVYAQRVDANGNPLWATNGVPVVQAPGAQSTAVAVTDGNAGAIIFWVDTGVATSVVRAQRIDSTGVRKWALGGIVPAPTGNPEFEPVAVPDGLGGAIVAFTRMFSGTDFDVFAQRMDGTGALLWGPGGLAVANSIAKEEKPAIATDESNGAWFAWRNDVSGDFDTWVQRIRYDSSNLYALNGSNTALLSGNANDPTMLSDGYGGAYLAWEENPAGNIDIYLWHGDGMGSSIYDLVLCNDPSDQFQPTLASDGDGGAYVTWFDQRSPRGVYGTHWLSLSVPAPGWASNGDPIGTVGAGFGRPLAVPDGFGGALVAWKEGFSYTQIYGTRLRPDGFTVASTWHGDSGNPIATTPFNDYGFILPDGLGGAFCAYTNTVNNSTNILAQHIDGFGMPGYARPTIISVKDYPNDQGGKVTLRWSPSYLDASPAAAIGSYLVWRQAPSTVAEAALRSGGRLVAAGTAPNPGVGRVFRRSVLGVQTTYWEFINSLPAAQLPGYSYSAPTGSDSVGGGNPRSVFMIEAQSAIDARAQWDSAPDSGFSVDNLPPVAPAPFTVNFAPPNGTFAAWNANAEADLAGYRLYRGFGLGFTPSIANRIYDGVTPSYHDVTSTAYVYKVCAYDIHGNEGGCTTAVTPGTTAAEGEIPKVLSLAPVDPNPARDGANLRFGLPHDGRLIVAIYDAQGRRVRTVIDAWLPAGIGLSRWDGRDAAGAEVGSGMYFVRLEAGGMRLTRRFVTLH